MEASILRYYHRVKFLVDRHRHLLIQGLAALIATDLMGMTLPWLIKEGIDGVVELRGVAPPLWRYPALILVAAMLQGVFRYLWRVHIHGFSRRCEADLRDRVFSHLQRLPLAYFHYTKTGDLMSRLTNDVQAVRELLGFGSLAIVDAAVVVTFSLCFMIAIDPWLTVWSLLAMPLITVAVRFFGRHIFRRSSDVQQQLSVVSAYVQENLAGIRVVQAYAQEENRIAGFGAISAEYMRRTLWLATLWGIFWPLIRMLSGLAAAIVLWLGGRQVLQGTMTLGEFVAFNGYLGMLGWPLMAVGHVVNQYQRGAAALSRIGEVLDTPPSLRYGATNGTPVGQAQGAVEFRNLTFAYAAQSKPALKDLTLTLPRGTICGIVGETGSGKSTLASLLLRLFEPPDGTVFVDGMDIKQIPLERLINAVASVSQDIFLFGGTIRDNLLFGAEEAGMQAVEECARMARLLPSVREFSARFDTVIGERGVRLSGGQKQRAALARAIIKNSPILILDDAFSSVDVETEEEILKELRGFMTGRTTLLISHRISTVRQADLIVYLHKGRIIERGTHAELVARKGAYSRLYQQQQLIREVEMLDRPDRQG